MRESFIIYKSFIDAGREIKNKVDRLNFYESIFQFALTGEELQLEGVAKAMFMLVKPQLLANQKRYENGNKGGKPPTETPPKPEPKPNLDVTKPEPNNNGNVNKNETVNDEGKNTTPSTSDFLKDLKTKVDIAKGIGDANFLTIAECRKLYDSNYQSQKIGVCTPSGWDFEKLKYFQDEFDLHISKTLTHKVISDYAKHFANWTAKLSKEQKQEILDKNNPTIKKNPYAHYGF